MRGRYKNKDGHEVFVYYDSENKAAVTREVMEAMLTECGYKLVLEDGHEDTRFTWVEQFYN